MANRPPTGRRRRAFALLLAFLAGTASARPATYRLDPDHSFVYFEVLHFGTSTIRGRFGAVDGEVVLDPGGDASYLGMRIATAGVDTGMPTLDARLRQPDLLASQDHPEAFFVARTFRFVGDRLTEVRGEFTLRGVSQGLSLFATRYGCRTETTGAAAVQVCGGDFEADFDRAAFGITFGLPFVADRVHLIVSVEGRRR